MAALTSVSRVGRRIPLGDSVLQVVRVNGNTGAASGSEWVAKADIGLAKIDAAWAQVIGPPADIVVNLLPNAQGTGGTEGDNPGDLGVETQLALTTGDLLIYVIGRVVG